MHLKTKKNFFINTKSGVFLQVHIQGNHFQSNISVCHPKPSSEIIDVVINCNTLEWWYTKKIWMGKIRIQIIVQICENLVSNTIYWSAWFIPHLSYFPCKLFPSFFSFITKFCIENLATFMVNGYWMKNLSKFRMTQNIIYDRVVKRSI